MRILIADADDYEATIYVREFRTRAFDVDVVDEGEACLAEARANRPDAIILDLVLPRRGGFAVLERLRADTETARIPIVVLARAAQLHDVERSGSPFFVKPYARPCEVIRRVEELIASRLVGAGQRAWGIGHPA